MAPASTTVCASSGVCLQMSDKAEAAIRFSAISGSCGSNAELMEARGPTAATVGRWEAHLHTEDEHGDGASVHHRLRQFYPKRQAPPS